MANPAPGFVSRPEHRVDIAAEPRRLRVELGGVTVADSARTFRVEETGYPPVHYFPAADVRTELLHETQHHTRCPFKGEASYWTIEAGGRRSENAVWSYREPYDEIAALGGYLAFYASRVDAIHIDPAGPAG